jgi:hypothetical protein
MELKPGMSALVTGGASGIGKRRPPPLPQQPPAAVETLFSPES